MTNPDLPVRAALAALGPARMPDDVAARIRARLAAELAATPAEDGTGRPTPGPTTPGPTTPGPTTPGPTAPGPDGAEPGPVPVSDVPVPTPAATGSAGTGSDGSPPDRPERGTRRAAPGPARPGRWYPRVRTAVTLVAVAVAALLVALPVLAVRDPGPAPAGTDGPLADRLRAAATGAGPPEGPLADPARRRGCLAAAGVADPTAPLLATRPYPVAGRPGVLLVLGTPHRGRYRLVVVGPGCGPDRGELLAELPAGP